MIAEIIDNYKEHRISLYDSLRKDIFHCKKCGIILYNEEMLYFVIKHNGYEWYYYPNGPNHREIYKLTCQEQQIKSLLE